MTKDRDNQIRVRAHEIWVNAGMPEGMAEVHWAQAEAEIDGPVLFAAAPPKASPPKPTKRKTRTAVAA